MKPFNLERAKAGDPVCTADGRPVEILKFDLGGTKFPIIGIVRKNGVEYAYQWTIDGQLSTNRPSKLNLQMVSVKREE